MAGYADTFKKLQPKYDPRHVEAYVRLQHSTLGHLSMDVLRDEAQLAAECIEIAGKAEAEQLAVSFGLLPEDEEDNEDVAYASESRLRLMEGGF